MSKIAFLKNPDLYEAYIAAVHDNKFGTWKIAEIKRFPSPTDILHGNIIEYTDNKKLCPKDGIKEIEEFTINNVIKTILK